MWVFRRFGYTEAANPNHVLAVMNGSGQPILIPPMGMVKTRHLEPTAQEVLAALQTACAGQGSKPQSIVRLCGSNPPLVPKVVSHNCVSRACEPRPAGRGRKVDRRAAERSTRASRDPGGILPATKLGGAPQHGHGCQPPALEPLTL